MLHPRHLSPCVLVLAVAAAGLGPAGAARADITYHNEEYSYTVNIPGDYVQLGPADLAKFETASGGQTHYDAVFSHKGPAAINVPIIAIQSSKGAVPEGKFGEFIKGIGVAVKSAVDTKTGVLAGKGVETDAVDAVTLDSPGHSFRYAMTMEASGVKVRTMACGRFGNKATVQMIYSDLLSNMDSNATQRETILTGLRFDPGFDFQPGQGEVDWAVVAQYGLESAAGLAVIIFLLVKQLSKKPQQPPQSPPPAT